LIGKKGINLSGHTAFPVVQGGELMQKWWWKVRHAVRGIMFPLICIQFIRTLILPNPLDVFVLFALFLVYIALLIGFL